MSNRQTALISLVGALLLAGCGGDSGVPSRSAICGNEGQACCEAVGCYDGLLCTQRVCRGLGGCTPVAETCDGRDNDCNGQVDDGAATGDCAARVGATYICKAGACACANSCSGACVDVNSDPENCGGCGKACTAAKACVNGACLSLTVVKWVIDSITLPTSRSQFSIDLDGDAKADNALANIINVFASQMIDAQAGLNAAVSSGSALHLVSLMTHDPMRMNDATAATTVSLAVAQPMPDFSGKGNFTVDNNQPKGTFAGKLALGGYSSSDPVTTKTPVSLILNLPVLSFGAPAMAPMLLPLHGAHIAYELTGNRLMSGVIQGSIKSTDVQDVVIPQLAAGLTRDLQTNPNSPSSRSSADLFDTGGCGAAMKGDKIISPCELANSDLIKNLLGPDIQVYGANGAYAPMPRSRTPDSLSLGIGFTAVAASF